VAADEAVNNGDKELVQTKRRQPDPEAAPPDEAVNGGD
jgi:hypothetical protein